MTVIALLGRKDDMAMLPISPEDLRVCNCTFK